MALMVGELFAKLGLDDKGFQQGLRDAKSGLSGVAAEATKSEGVLRRMGGAMGGVAKFAGGFMVAEVGMRAFGAAVGGVTHAVFGLNNEREAAHAGILSFTKDEKVTADILKQVREEAGKTPFAFAEMSKATNALLAPAKMANVGWMDLLKTGEILAAKNPMEGLEGASFALKEAISGDFTSIIERFNLSRSTINKLKDEGVPALEIVKRAMAEQGMDESLVAGMAETAAGKWSTFLDTLDTVKMRITQPIFEGFKTALTGIQGTLDANAEGINRFADAVGVALGRGLQMAIGFITGSVVPAFRTMFEAVDTFIVYYRDHFEDFEDAGFFAMLGFRARDLVNAFNEHLLPAITAVVGFIRNPTLPTIGEIVAALAGMMGAIRGNETVMNILIPVIGSVVGMLAAYKVIQLASTAAALAHKAVTTAMRAPTLAWAAAQGVLNAVMMANPFTLVAVLLAGLVAGLVVAYKTSETFRNVVNGAWEAVRSSASSVIGWFTSSFIPFFTGTIPWAFGALRDALISTGAAIKDAIVAPFNAAKRLVQPIFDTLNGWIKDIKGWIGGIGGGDFMAGLMGGTPGAGPVPGGVFTQGFGRTSFSGNYASGHHSGFDYAAPSGTPIYATRSGRVSTAGWLGGYGNAVMTQIGPGLQLLYGHMSKIMASAGQFVKAGQMIGLVGSTGFSTGPHVHFEARRNGTAINPAAFLANGAFVRAGNPLLSVIGEGRHDEVVSPVPKLRQVVREELAVAGGATRVYNVYVTQKEASEEQIIRTLRRYDRFYAR